MEQNNTIRSDVILSIVSIGDSVDQGTLLPVRAGNVEPSTSECIDQSEGNSQYS